mgnify:CR=1 FL=1
MAVFAGGIGQLLWVLIVGKSFVLRFKFDASAVGRGAVASALVSVRVLEVTD